MLEIWKNLNDWKNIGNENQTIILEYRNGHLDIVYSCTEAHYEISRKGSNVVRWLYGLDLQKNL